MRVIVATDGSQFSQQALVKAGQYLSGKPNVEVKVVSVYQDVPALATEPFAVGIEYCQDLVEAAHREANGYVADGVALLQKAANGSKPRVTSEVLSGIAAQEIVEKAKEWHADLIVVGSHGRGFWGRMLGSVSDAVVHTAPCSVMVVRSE